MSTRIRCNHCTSEFPEEYVDVDALGPDSGETCPVCCKGDALIDLEPGKSGDMDADAKLAAIAFVKGAKYWEFKKSGATMWQADQEVCAAEAEKRYKYKPTLNDLFPREAFMKIAQALAEADSAEEYPQ